MFDIDASDLSTAALVLDADIYDTSGKVDDWTCTACVELIVRPLPPDAIDLLLLGKSEYFEL
jgi:hypothetical protein